MRERVPEWLKQGGTGILVGLVLGIVVGWWLWPVTYTNTAPAALREDYRNDYVLMTAAAFEADHDLQKALSRLENLDPDDPVAPVAELAHTLIDNGGSRQDITRLALLARACGDVSPRLMSYLEGRE